MNCITEIKIEDRKTHYYTIIYFNGERLIYHNNNYDKCHTMCNGIEILKNSSATHNFAPFLSDGKIYAIGGQDKWKLDQKTRGLSFEEFKEFQLKRIGKPYLRTRERWTAAMKTINCYPMRTHSDGIYLFTSNDGYKFEASGKPIITVDTPGYNKETKWKSSGFDGQISIIKNDCLYYAYFRNNTGPKKRTVQVGTSEDLTDWNFSPVIFPELPESVYCLCVNDSFYGLAPIIINDRAKLYLMKSRDGTTWNIDRQLFDEPAVKTLDDEYKNSSMPCNGIFIKDNKMRFWIHHGYLGIGTDKVFLREYEIDL